LTRSGPLTHLLEGHLTILLVNPAHIKQVPGRKTEVNDCQWIAELLKHGASPPDRILLDHPNCRFPAITE